MNKVKKRVLMSMLLALCVGLTACKSTEIVQSVHADSETSAEEQQGNTEEQQEKPDGDKNQSSLASEYALSRTVTQQGDKEVVTNPESMAVVVNKQRSLPDGYEPPDLVEPNVKFSFNEKVEKRLMRQEAAEALEKLFEGGKQDGIHLFAVSGYRSYKRQVTVFNSNVKRNGREYAEKVSAVPGKSEHQTGLAMDVSSESASFGLEQMFGDTPEGKWLAEHAAEYGFIIRYLEGKEDVTGYVYEPWHIRYVGVDLAKEIEAAGVTLEQYLDDTGSTKA